MEKNISWIETHFEICVAIGAELAKHPNEMGDFVSAEQLEGGRSGVMQYAEDLTNEFEEQWRNHEWGIDNGPEWYEAIEEFLHTRL